MRICTCAKCGRIMNDSEDLIYIVNEGTDKQYVECEICHDDEWERNNIILCDGCGRWFTTDMLHSEEVTPGHTFCPCPVCGKDIVEGETREEFLEEIEDTYIPRYSVVVIYGNGTTRGFIVNADGRKQAMEKLFQKIDIGFVTSIHIAEILLEEDEF